MRRLSLWQVLNSALNGFQKDIVGGLVGLEMGSEKGFQWAGFGGCGGGLVGVEGVWWVWRGFGGCGGPTSSIPGGSDRHQFLFDRPT